MAQGEGLELASLRAGVSAGYSPDYNPIERLWLRLKADWFWDFIARTEAELIERLCTALNSFVADPTKTASICSLRK